MPRFTSACFLRAYLWPCPASSLGFPGTPPSYGAPCSEKRRHAGTRLNRLCSTSHTFNMSQISRFSHASQNNDSFPYGSFVNDPIWRWLPESWLKARCRELTKLPTWLCLCPPSGGELSLALHRMTQEARAGWLAGWWMRAHKQRVQKLFRNLTIINGPPSEGANPIQFAVA